VADHGRAALDAWDAEPFDLVLMDVQMPEMDGLDATRAIRAREAGTGRHVPIIAMTARAMPGDREQCLESGMDGYVSKPVRQRDLYAAIAPFFPEAAAATGEGVADAAETGVDAIDDELTPMIDWDSALRNMAGNDELLRDVAEESVRELPQLLARLEEAVADGRRSEIGRLAHTIRGAGRTFASAALQHAARQVEDAAVDGSLPLVPALLPPLRAALAGVTSGLREFIAACDAPRSPELRSAQSSPVHT
jgi:CheY-like chemotaxis protein